jgi:hypothetical protein
MDRRGFLTTTAAATAAAGAVSAAPEPAARELYEVRTYHLANDEKLAKMEAYLAQAVVPALNRRGLKPVGVFAPAPQTADRRIFVLIPHATAATVLSAARLVDDPEFARAGAELLALPPTDALYTRYESALLHAFAGMPKLEAPAVDKPRIFELRIYESHNERTGDKKVEMFDKGEIDIFRRTGLQPVFFGQSLVGAAMPNLTYMLTYPDAAGRKKAWDAFLADPAWKKLSTTAGYTNREIITRITAHNLAPLACSQV